MKSAIKMFSIKRNNDSQRIYVENRAIEWAKKDLLSKVSWCFSRRPHQQKQTRTKLYQNKNSPSISNSYK